MNNYQKVLLSPNATIRRALEIIDSGSMRIALVADENQKLLGTLTDGDVRRAILSGAGLDDLIETIYYRTPTTCGINDSKEKILQLAVDHKLYQIPVIDAEGRIVGIAEVDELLQPIQRTNKVVLMAGGLGSRLRPLTDDCPKPMLRVGNKPLLETILENFIEYGFNRFYISVNYMSDVVKSYFGDGSRWNVDICYLQESQPLGTAGALSLLPEKPREPLLVINGDLLTKVNLSQLLDFHTSHQAMATMCVREYDFQVPYGVVKIDKHCIVGIDEKPVQHFFVNGGIYVLEPDALDLILPNTYFDMPTLFEKLIKQKKEAVVFPIREYWLDIGHMADYERANCEYMTVFA